MKILLVEQPQPYLVNPGQQVNLGLLYLAAAIKKENKYHVEIAQLAEYEITDAVKYIEKSDADIVGFTGTSLDYHTCLNIARQIPKKAKIIGGVHASILPETVDKEIFDSIIVGEAENIINEILSDYEKGQLQQRYYGKPEYNLDTLSFPAKDLIKHHGKEIFLKPQNEKSTVMITSRGCPFSCAFCASHSLYNGRVRYRSPDNVYEEIKECVEKYGIREFKFSDDSITIPEQRLKRLCELIKSLDIKWRASIRVVPNSIKMFRMMKESGCQEVSFGVESADQNVLDILNKKVTPEQSRTALINAHKAGLPTRILMMIGTPGETRRTVDLNVKFIESTPFETLSLKVFVPLPGSDLWFNPHKYDTRINKKAYDFKNLNFFFWEKGDNGSPRKREVNSLLETRQMSNKELNENIKRMFEYADERNWINKGV